MKKKTTGYRKSYWKWYGLAITVLLITVINLKATIVVGDEDSKRSSNRFLTLALNRDRNKKNHNNNGQNSNSNNGNASNSNGNNYRHNHNNSNSSAHNNSKSNSNSNNWHKTLYNVSSMQDNGSGGSFLIGSQLERVPPIPNTTEFHLEQIPERTSVHRTNRCSAGLHRMHYPKKRRRHRSTDGYENNRDGDNNDRKHQWNNNSDNNDNSYNSKNGKSRNSDSENNDEGYYQHRKEHHHHQHHHKQRRKGRGKRHDQDIDMQRVEVIKQQILSKLGLSTIPNVTNDRSMKFLLEALSHDPRPLIVQEQEVPTPSSSSTVDGRNFRSSTKFDTSQSSADSEPDDFYGRTSEIIGFAEPGYTLNGQKLLEFSWSQDMAAADLNVKSATLWVKIEFRPDVPYNIRRSPPNLNFTFWVFRVITTGLSNSTYLSGKEFEEHSRLSASLPVTLSSLGWKSFDITRTVQEWYATEHKDRLRLLIDCSGCSEMVTPVFFQDSRQENEWEKPFLLIQTDPTVTRRVRRRAIDCSLAKRDQCCKQQFYIRFRDIGWHKWIIAPSGYYANYCRGDCGGYHRTPDTYINNHAYALDDYKKIHQYSLFEPCCAPVKFSSISLIYITPGNNIIKRDLPKMVVDECGCP